MKEKERIKRKKKERKKKQNKRGRQEHIGTAVEEGPQGEG